jgi:RNA polymerase sigma-70 factor (ECF subfamily)
MHDEDPAWLERLRARDEEAFARLIRTHQHRVFALVYRMLGDRAEAEDLAQEVFVTVFKSIDTFRGESQLSTWLLRIAANHCRNRLRYLRRRNHHGHQDIDDTPESAYDRAHRPADQPPDRMLEGARLEAAVQAALDSLDEDHRLILVLRDLEHMAYADIAQTLGVAEGTVKSRLFRARLQLRARIPKEYCP